MIFCLVFFLFSFFFSCFIAFFASIYIFVLYAFPHKKKLLFFFVGRKKQENCGCVYPFVFLCCLFFVFSFPFFVLFFPSSPTSLLISMEGAQNEAPPLPSDEETSTFHILFVFLLSFLVTSLFLNSNKKLAVGGLVGLVALYLVSSLPFLGFLNLLLPPLKFPTDFSLFEVWGGGREMKRKKEKKKKEREF